MQLLLRSTDFPLTSKAFLRMGVMGEGAVNCVWMSSLGWLSFRALFSEELKACGSVCFKIPACFLYPGDYIHSFIVIFQKMLLTIV